MLHPLCHIFDFFDRFIMQKKNARVQIKRATRAQFYSNRKPGRVSCGTASRPHHACINLSASHSFIEVHQYSNSDRFLNQYNSRDIEWKLGTVA
jgi:uracil DNA glycosylase